VALSYAQLESKPQIQNDYYGRATQRANLNHKGDRTQKISDHSKRKNAKQIVAVSYYGRTTQRATLSHKDPNLNRNTRAWILMHNVPIEVTYATHRSGGVTTAN
jgi:hypothetical protein